MGEVEYLVIGIGGFLGANARYLLAGWATRQFGFAFPYGTFIINISGSFILGLFMTVLQPRFLSPYYRLFFAVGFLGAYTTFSTFTYETLLLMQNGQNLLASVYVVSSTIVGLVGVWLGFLLGTAL
jgi:CrcB protein